MECMQTTGFQPTVRSNRLYIHKTTQIHLKHLCLIYLYYTYMYYTHICIHTCMYTDIHVFTYNKDNKRKPIILYCPYKLCIHVHTDISQNCNKHFTKYDIYIMY